ncbi:HAD family hydrolase [Tundrisphaera sp. TA3]|uniref:HAD family hydrolase n=1 Tax=Tundrisphaera sp. TA3 TaxID=3435775 RepID=UPI003EB6E5F3
MTSTSAADQPMGPAPGREGRDFFIGIDSDGCVFDTMGVKHKECFIPEFIEHFGLHPVADHAREAAEFANLLSKWRGINRFHGYLMVLELLAEHPGVAGSGFEVPKAEGLKAWLERERKPGNPTLAAEVARTGDPDLALTLRWSEAVNRSIERTVRDVPPFPLVRECLGRMAGRAEVVVISSTPGEALDREWEQHDLRKYVARIAGQEQGAKVEVLAAASRGFDRSKVLMMGDAPGDHQAALKNGALFYPIEPGHEAESWRRLHDEALPRFFDGTYAGAYMDEQVRRFEAGLPDTPPWKRS